MKNASSFPLYMYQLQEYDFCGIGHKQGFGLQLCCNTCYYCRKLQSNMIDEIANVVAETKKTYRHNSHSHDCGLFHKPWLQVPLMAVKFTGLYIRQMDAVLGMNLISFYHLRTSCP